MTLIILSHWMTPDATAAALALNTPETEGRKAGRWIEGNGKNKSDIRKERESGCVCVDVCESVRGVSAEGLNFPREPLTESRRDR